MPVNEPKMLSVYTETHGPYRVDWRDTNGLEGYFDPVKEIRVFDSHLEVVQAPINREYDARTNFTVWVLPMATHHQLRIEKVTPSRALLP